MFFLTDQKYKDQPYAYGHWVVEFVHRKVGKRITSSQNESNSTE